MKKEQKTREQLEAEAKEHFNKKLDELKEQNIKRGKFLMEENKRLIQMSDYINNALNNPDRAYESRDVARRVSSASGHVTALPIYRSGVVSNQLLHAYPDTFCQKTVEFLLPEYQRIAPLYILTTKELILSYLPKWCDKPLNHIHNFINTLNLHHHALKKQEEEIKQPSEGHHANVMSKNNSQFSILNCQLKRSRRDSINKAIESLSIYHENYILLDKEDERAATLELPINRLATMLDYIQFLDPTPDTHTRLFTFLATLVREAKQMNHRQLRLHNSAKKK